MPASYSRDQSDVKIHKVASILESLSAEFFLKEVRTIAPTSILTVTRLDYDVRQKQATCWVGVHNMSIIDFDKLTPSLEKQLRHFIGSKAKFRYVPAVVIKRDTSLDDSQKIQELILL